MKSKKGFTLVELIVAIVLVGVLIIAISSVESSFYGLKAGFLDKQAPAIKGNMALATIFERMLRAGSENKSSKAASFSISQDGTRLDFTKMTPTKTDEHFYLDNKSLKYDSAGRVTTLLTDVRALKFFGDMNGTDAQGKDNHVANRLTVEITLDNNDTFRTSVTPRNQFTAKQVVN